MSVGSLIWGWLALVALLTLAGTLGGVGTVELTIWLVLVVIWLVVWLLSRRPETTRR